MRPGHARFGKVYCEEIPRTDKIPNMTEYFPRDRLLGIHFKGNGTAILNWGAFRPLEGSGVLVGKSQKSQEVWPNECFRDCRTRDVSIVRN